MPHGFGFQVGRKLAEDVFAASVLIVDDMPLMQKMIGITLQKAGFTNLLYADDGDVALDMVAAERPDLVILDINMPRVSGYEVCKALRANAAHQNLYNLLPRRLKNGLQCLNQVRLILCPSL